MIPEKLVAAAVKERARHEVLMTHDIYGKGYCMICDLDLDYHKDWEPHLERAALTAAFAVLPETDEMFKVVAEAFSDDGTGYPAVIIDALAKEFGS